jgi:hypothetical protein
MFDRFREEMDRGAGYAHWDKSKVMNGAVVTLGLSLKLAAALCLAGGICLLAACRCGNPTAQAAQLCAACCAARGRMGRTRIPSDF